MSVLALDTAGPSPSVAVFARARLHEQELSPDGRASEELLPAIARALDSAGLALADCTRVAVCAGPGSFTGVRVGLATAWAFGRALRIPVEAISTLEVLAEAARGSSSPPTRIAAFLDAGRGELAAQIFDVSGVRARPVAPFVRIPAAEASPFAAGAAMVSLPAGLIGPAGSALGESLAAALALAAARAPREGPTDLAAISAIYSRASAAEEKHGAA
jgi:tRNA threonylcarbamoyladenosine biosynthesis protein TsaB